MDVESTCSPLYTNVSLVRMHRSAWNSEKMDGIFVLSSLDADFLLADMLILQTVPKLEAKSIPSLHGAYFP